MLAVLELTVIHHVLTFSWKNVVFFGNAHFLSRKSKGTGTVLLAREQAHSLLFKTSELFDNGQLLVILERI